MKKEDKLAARIGSRIRSCRTDRGMKQAELRDRLGIAQNHISNLENGNRRPSYDLLMEICEEFGVTPDFFLLEKSEPYENERLREFYAWASGLEGPDLEHLLKLLENIKELMGKKEE